MCRGAFLNLVPTKAAARRPPVLRCALLSAPQLEHMLPKAGTGGLTKGSIALGLFQITNTYVSQRLVLLPRSADGP
jgi:hypothetical protein